jgi:hypothetical protein
MSDAATLAGAGLLYTMLVMWATQPPYTCALMPDRARQLNLGHSVDREHLDNDARQIPRMARRYATHLRASTHNDISDVERVVYRCTETLTRDVMNTHDVTREQLRVR